ncbi:P2 family phage major capsid protein [Citrobacter portucalensis]|uniref:P2 family phage major capsid protein n=1 Tax=Citrobacter portucalensis TaxID=1639133 RepID=UPI000C21E18D|nr:P2 family phage major capsid protein [Citrobacter portucalensis]ATX90201.1 hypothetical protein AM348_00330 [Citrobacter freundii]AVD76572.1 hypothetical protein AM350_02110 [Citrobacter freundii]
MYAFKTERPDAARRYHNKFVTGTNYQEESNRRFALSEPTENILRTSILESGWLIKNITLRDVNAVSGNAVNIGASELHTGRVDGKELIDAIPPEEREKALKLLLAAQKNG